MPTAGVNQIAQKCFPCVAIPARASLQARTAVLPILNSRATWEEMRPLDKERAEILNLILN